MKKMPWCRFPAFLAFTLLLGGISLPLKAQQPWECQSYPDEKGLQERLAPMLGRIAAKGYGERSLAVSRCPDTGLPVKTWALEGETVISPYTGRAYVQGPTGYFGPRQRNQKGEISAFGGDPLKYDLPPATATLLLNPADIQAKAFLSIPGNLSQQYHFACKNWARFFPLLADSMGPDWKQAFFEAADHYRETRRVGMGRDEDTPLTAPHSLVGQAGQLLNGNSIDGGTENHKTMWRTSCLVYAQQFPEGQRISGLPLPEALAQVKASLRDFLQRLLQTGNGEYDSSIYYPHSIEGFLNLYDFSTDPELREMAKFALDYYFLTYGLKVVDGVIAGAQKRGHLPIGGPGEMEIMLWAYFNAQPEKMGQAIAGLHQTTSTYRPNEVIYNIVTGNIALPFEARMSRPFYHMDRFNAFQESFYRSPGFGMGNVHMSIVDNPNQQVTWSLVAKGKNGPLFFTGGQPYPQTESGHSPYTQTIHSKGTLLLLTAPTDPQLQRHPGFEVSPQRVNPWHLPDNAQVADYELANRRRYALETLQEVPAPERWNAAAVEDFWEKKTYMAASWLWIPRGLEEKRWSKNRLLLRAGQTWVAVMPLNGQAFFVDPSPEERGKLRNRRLKEWLERYELMVAPGAVSGYVVDATEASAFASMADFERALEEKTQLDTRSLSRHLRFSYRSLYGEDIDFFYRPSGLKAAGRVGGKTLDFDQWTKGAVYSGPYLQIQNGRLETTDGKQSYQVDFRGERPLYSYRRK